MDKDGREVRRCCMIIDMDTCTMIIRGRGFVKQVIVKLWLYTDQSHNRHINIICDTFRRKTPYPLYVYLYVLDVSNSRQLR